MFLISLLVTAIAAAQTPACPEDVNADGAVNSVDLARVLLAWGPCTQDSPHEPDDEDKPSDPRDRFAEYLVNVMPPAEPSDAAGTILYDRVISWDGLRDALQRPREEARLVIIDLGGRMLLQGNEARATIKGDDLILRNGRLIGELELQTDARRILIENISFDNRESADAIRTRERDGLRPQDLILRNVSVDGGSHALDFSRGVSRARIENLKARNVRYGAYIDGDATDIEFINPEIADIQHEHGLRFIDVERMNIIGGRVQRGPKTSITIRRGVKKVTVAGVECIGTVSVGPDKRDFPPGTSSDDITLVGCRIDSSDHNGHPIIFWPTVNNGRVIECALIDTDAPPDGIYLIVAPSQYGRSPARAYVKGNTLNGEAMAGTSGVDAGAGQVAEIP